MALRIARRDLIKASSALAGASALGLSFGRLASALEVTLRMAWWGSEERHQRTIEALDLFAEVNPNVAEVTPEIGTFDSHFDKLAVQTAGGNAPDVFQMSGQYINEYAARGALLDLNQYIPDIIDVSGWDESVTQHGLINGVMAGLPIGLDAYTVCYDATVIEENGFEVPAVDWSWDDFAEWATNISETMGEGYYGTGDAGGRYEPLETFVRQRGKTLFSEDGAALGFEKQDLIEWFTYWDDLRKAGVAAPAEVEAAAQEQEQSPLVQGIAAVYWTTSSQYVNLQGLTQNDVALHTMPHSEEGESGSFIRPGLFISAYVDTQYAEESAQLIQFLLNDPDAAAILQTARGVPPSPAVRELLIDQVSEAERHSFEYITQVTDISTQKNILTPPGGREVTDLISRTYEAIAFEQTSIEDGVDQIFEEAASLLGV